MHYAMDWINEMRKEIAYIVDKRSSIAVNCHTFDAVGGKVRGVGVAEILHELVHLVRPVRATTDSDLERAYIRCFTHSL